MQKETQLRMNFDSPVRQPKPESAAKRILKNFRRQQRLTYFAVYAGFKQDRFIAVNGMQVY